LSQDLIPAIYASNQKFQLSAFDGSTGSNRSHGDMQIAATNDAQAILAWLIQFKDNKNTFDSYRKEALRLYIWSVVQASKPVSSLTHEDLLAYDEFLSNPQPSDYWVAEKGRRFGFDDERWRPFHGPLAVSSKRQSKVILNSMFSWLVSAGYLKGNPLGLSKKRKKRSTPKVIHCLDPMTWAEVKAYITRLSKYEDPVQQLHYVRIRWLFSLLYMTGMRISEVAHAVMGDFYCRRDNEGNFNWWLGVVGKGGRLRNIPISNELMDELKVYRQFLKLSDTPSASETTPLFASTRNPSKMLTRSSIHALVKNVFACVADELRLSEDPQKDQKANALEEASTHWLRHTYGSHMANSGADLRVVRDNLGHSSLTTTSLYLHAEDDQRHKETTASQKLNWDMSKPNKA
jgi:integrase/recombinase XerD